MPSKYVNMADINRNPTRTERETSVPVPSQPPAQDPRELAPSDLISHVELLFFAYRDFTGDADAVLEEYGFGRAHHRVLHFVSRNPGLRVANLLEILKITKQSLARVLKQLVEDGFITQKAGAEDRRERLLFVTSKGAKLVEKLTALQVQRIQAAVQSVGSDAAFATRRFLLAMISDEDRAQVEGLIKGPHRSGKGKSVGEA